MMGGMGGMGGGPEAEMKAKSQRNQQDFAAKNAGEKEGGVDGKTWKWEQTSKYGESEILIRFSLAEAAGKKDVKVVFKASSLLVTVAGVELINGPTFGMCIIDDCTWC